jgi:dipeptidyl aminopeptidase/acylaminoacyl peptidase
MVRKLEVLRLTNLLAGGRTTSGLIRSRMEACCSRRRIRWNKLSWILVPTLAVGCASLAADTAPGRTAATDASLEIFFESDRSGSTDVWVLTAKGKARTEATRPGSVEAQPTSSPQGTAGYTSDRDGDYDIYADTKDGTVQLTHDPAPDYSPAWTPDGKRIAFVSERFGNKDIFITSVELGASFQRLTTSRAADMDPTWAPNSLRIALSSNRAGTYDIWLFDIGSKHRLTTNAANDFEPAFSPGGGRVAFTRRNTSGNYDIWVKQTNGEGLMRLTTDPAEDSEPTWSPDGQSIAFVSNRGGNYDVYVMNADGSGETNFSESPGSIDLAPNWERGGVQVQLAAAPETTMGGVTCGPRSGTDRGETINGTASADVICGRGGKDKIYGKGGNDIIDGGGGKDEIRGGPGKDRIVSRDGKKDILLGGDHNDRARTDGTPPDIRKSIEAPL